MSESNENKKNAKSSNYVRTFRSGAVAANVFSRQAPGGFEYLVFSLSRSWKTSNSKEGYSQSFFANNDEALHAVIDQACDFIDSQGVGTRDAQIEEADATATETAIDPASDSVSCRASGKPNRTMQDALQDALSRSPNGRYCGHDYRGKRVGERP